MSDITGAVGENGAEVTLDAIASDVDRNDTLTYWLDDTGTRGSVVDVGDGTYLYAAGSAFDHLGLGETAEDIFLYAAVDNHRASATGVARVTVTGANDGPVALDVTAELSEDYDGGSDTDPNDPVYSVTVDFTDLDENDTHSVTLDTTGFEGEVIDLGDGTYNVITAGAFDWLAEGETTERTFDYTVTDQHGASSDAEISVTIVGVNDAPLAVGDVHSLSKTDLLLAWLNGTEITGNVLANDSDPDGDALTVSAVDGSDTNLGALQKLGGLAVTVKGDGSYTLELNDLPAVLALSEGNVGGGSLSYTASDGFLTDQATASFEVVGSIEAAGSDKIDHLRGTDESDILDALGGNDHVFGRDGADLIFGRDGDDRLIGGDGDDFIFGGEGNDQLHGGEGNDWAFYDGDFADFRIKVGMDGDLSVIDRSPADGNEGNDQLHGIEFIAFTDGIFNVANGVFLL